MKCWRWLLAALVVTTLGCLLLPTTSSAADRTAHPFWVDGGGFLMGDPDGGSPGSGSAGQSYMHDFRNGKSLEDLNTPRSWLRQLGLMGSLRVVFATTRL